MTEQPDFAVRLFHAGDPVPSEWWSASEAGFTLTFTVPMRMVDRGSHFELRALEDGDTMVRLHGEAEAPCTLVCLAPWLGDARDNPRDPGFEPFWMRDAARPVVVQAPVYSHQSSYGIMVDSGATGWSVTNCKVLDVGRIGEWRSC